MRWIRLSLFLILMGTLLACTRSAADSTGSDLLPEQIARTLTAAPTLPPSRTPPPTATPQPSATAIPPSQEPPTATPTEGPTPTASPPPLPEGDPRQGLNLAAPHLTDDFQVRYGWYEFNDASAATIRWERGRMTVTDNRADEFLWWSTSGETASDLYAEVTASIQDCQGKDLYGLAVRIGGSGYDRGYTLEVSCDGHYRMRKIISGAAPEVMLNWTVSDAIETGGQASNRLGFFAEGDQLIGFVNGQQLEDVRDPDFIFGNFGLFSEAVDSDSVTAIFEEFALWYLNNQ
ncbi:MAG: hypothetical protein ACLFWD_11405 [Anaerolineales bacterium]